MWEESLRMPFLARYPRSFPAGATSDAIVNDADFAPTILEMAGVPKPDFMQGRSFAPILKGQPPPSDWPTATYYRYWMHLAHHDNPAHYGIRTKEYKLIYVHGLPLDAEGAVPSPTEPYWELYDLVKDPREMNNLYGDPALADVTLRLKGELKRLCASVGDVDDERVRP
ncbi:MAG: sulfatase/phosphatase domain-containing protein [Isosphaeraceae bacterium]